MIGTTREFRWSLGVLAVPSGLRRLGLGVGGNVQSTLGYDGLKDFIRVGIPWAFILIIVFWLPLSTFE